MEYPEALAWLYRLGGYEARGPEALRAGHWGLERTRRLLEALGDPQRAFRSLHIAGTKGKGSVAAIAHSLLRAMGQPTGLYTSPHLTSFRERIRIDGPLIPEEMVVGGVVELQRHAPPGLTSFEAFTGLALWAFREAGLPWAVVEVGLGGRLDSTNLIRPRATAITPIGLEHTQILGSSLAEIAGEKAGILKPGVPLVLGRQPPEARQAILERAAGMGVPVLELGHDLAGERLGLGPWGQRFRVTRGLPAGPYELRLLGDHQLDNALVAMALVQAGVGPVKPAALEAGLAAARWPGRLEILGRRPWVIVDAAHTPHSTRALCQALDRCLPARRTVWIFATLNDKDASGMLEEIGRRSVAVLVPPIRHPRAAAPAPGWGRPAADVEEALQRALELAGPEDRVVASGSVALAGEVRLAWLRRAGRPLPPVDPPLPP